MTKYAAFFVNAAYFLFGEESEICLEIPPAYSACRIGILLFAAQLLRNED